MTVFDEEDTAGPIQSDGCGTDPHRRRLTPPVETAPVASGVTRERWRSRLPPPVTGNLGDVTYVIIVRAWLFLAVALRKVNAGV
jgi:hypothetical protein